MPWKTPIVPAGLALDRNVAQALLLFSGDVDLLHDAEYYLLPARA